MKIGFDNDKYLAMQSEHIRERIKKFDNKLYLEFGGKLFDDYHASRVLPGFQPDSKLQMLLQLKDQAEVVIVINAEDIVSSKVRGDYGITYDLDVLRLIDAFQERGLFVGSVCVTMYTAAPEVEAFEKRLNSLGIRVYTHIAECAGVKDAPLSSSAGLLLPEPEPGHFALLDSSKEAPMQEAIRAAGSEGDSVGGALETIVTGLPAGIGEPWFDSVESELAHLMFAVPACKGLEFGAGFAFASMRGSEANDPFVMRNGQVATATNKNGGINGGITNGMPLVFRTVLKPTPSIYKQQHTVDYIARQDANLQIKGRHDPCIVPRAAVVQNTLAAFGLLDLLTVRYGTLAQKHGLPQE